MRVQQVILEGATAFDEKLQRVDQAVLKGTHEIVSADPDVVHVYAARNARTKRFSVPMVTSAGPRRWRRYTSISPIAEVGFIHVPEAVEDVWFGVVPASSPAPQRPAGGPHHTVASFGRRAIRNIVEQTVARIHRTRDDVEWIVFNRLPTPEDLSGVDVWIDPAIDATDFDGFAAEALVRGLPVVATRTPINVSRLEQGRTGLLVPPDDPNELAHAILSALFKPEVAQQKIDAARQTRSKFRAQQRVRVLAGIYGSLVQSPNRP